MKDESVPWDVVRGSRLGWGSSMAGAVVSRWWSRKVTEYSVSARGSWLLPFLAAISAMFLALVGSPGDARGQPPTYRALLTYGEEQRGMKEGAEHLKEVLAKGTNWLAANITVKQAPNTGAALKADVAAACGANVAGDVCLFAYMGHGAKVDDADADDANTGDEIKPLCTRLPCDEAMHPMSRVRPRKFILDDELPSVFTGIQGNLILVFDNCFSGGLAGPNEGTKDLIKATTQPMIVLQSCGTNQRSAAAGVWPNTLGPGGGTHWHGFFSGGLVEGLADSKVGPGPANADKAPLGTLTVTEWYDYAAGVVADYRALHRQDPEIESGGGLDPATTAVLQYTNGQTDLSDHAKHIPPRSQRFVLRSPEFDLWCVWSPAPDP